MINVLTDYFFYANKITLTKNGNLKALQLSDIDTALNQFVDKSYFSPAFAVSLHDHTTEKLKTGLWLEFEFSTTQIFGEMPFDKLLINLLPDMYGINIIRYNFNKYQGRCYYLNLHNNSSTFFNFLNKISK